MVVTYYFSYYDMCKNKTLVLLKGLTPIFVFLIFTFVMHILFTKGGFVLIQIGAFTIESAGVLEGFLFL